MNTVVHPTKPLPEIPYRGIESFRYIDQRVFCAREDETWELLSQILINRGVLLYGDSGSGKSSLINAGLIPAAIKEDLWAHRLRIQPRRGREIKVERIPTKSDNGPPYLPSDLVDPVSQNDAALSFEISIEEFYKQLEAIRRRAPDEPHPLLIVDQFEEFITLFEEASHAAEASAAEDALKTQQDILSVFTSILQDDSLPVKILFVFREEYLAKLNILFKNSPELLDQYVRLLPPRVEDAEQIVLAPFIDAELKARFAGKAYQRHVKELGGALGKTIAAQIQQRSESGFINLTELQVVCRKLWESADPIKYFQANGSDIQKVLESYWVDALKNLGDLYEPAIALLGHMVTSTNTRNIVSEPDLMFFEKDNFTAEQITKALNALVDSKLVRREPRHKIHFYEIVSEFLVPWIREKKTARLAQIEANRIAAETKERLQHVEKARRYLAIGAMTCLALLIVVFGFYVKNKRLEAALAEQEKLRLLRLKTEYNETLPVLSVLIIGSDEQTRLDALKTLMAFDQKGQLPRSFIPVIVAVTANEKNKDVAQAASYFYTSLKDLNQVQQADEVPQSNANLTNYIIETAKKNTDLTESNPATQLPPRMYFQLASDSQSGRADRIASALRSIGFVIPAYQVVKRSPSSDQLRYYKPQNETETQSINTNRDGALAKIREADGRSWSAVQLPASSAVRPNHFELWFADDPVAQSNVTLRLVFETEDGAPLPVRNPRVTLEPVPFSGRQLIESSTSLTAPPGNYILFVQVPGYPLYRAEISLQGTQVTHRVRLRPN